MFYSRSPFGELKKLVEDCKYFPDYFMFRRDAPKNQLELLVISTGNICHSYAATLVRGITGDTEQAQKIGISDSATKDSLIAITPRDQQLINDYLSTGINIPFTNIYEKFGNFDTALDDLNEYFANRTGRPVEERVPGRLYIVRLDEQVTIVARNFSGDGRPTIEIQDKSSGTSVALAKVRYEFLP